MADSSDEPVPWPPKQQPRPTSRQALDPEYRSKLRSRFNELLFLTCHDDVLERYIGRAFGQSPMTLGQRQEAVSGLFAAMRSQPLRYQFRHRRLISNLSKMERILEREAFVQESPKEELISIYWQLVRDFQARGGKLNAHPGYDSPIFQSDRIPLGPVGTRRAL